MDVSFTEFVARERTERDITSDMIAYTILPVGRWLLITVSLSLSSILASEYVVRVAATRCKLKLFSFVVLGLSVFISLVRIHTYNIHYIRFIYDTYC